MTTLQTDPTRTATLRRVFAADLSRRFAKIAAAVVDLVVTQDAFGLGKRSSVLNFDPSQPRDDHGRWAEMASLTPTQKLMQWWELSHGLRWEGSHESDRNWFATRLDDVKASVLAKGINLKELLWETNDRYARLYNERFGKDVGRLAKDPIGIFAEALGAAFLHLQRQQTSEIYQQEKVKFEQLKREHASKDVPIPPSYGGSKAQVRAMTRGSLATFQKKVDTLFGRPTHIQELASVVGAPDEATVSVTAQKDGSLGVRIGHPDYTARRTILREEGKLVIQNDEFFMRPDRTGTGLGTKVLAKQIENAQRLGVDHLQTYAAGSKNGAYNGYYTWPRFGYDMAFPTYWLGTAFWAELKSKFPHAKTVADIMLTPEGRDWWKENGRELPYAKFDLTPGSRSLRTFYAYLAERSARTGMTTNAMQEMSDHGDGIEHAYLTGDEEAALDAAWDRMVETQRHIKRKRVGNADWSFRTSDEQLSQFRDWLADQVQGQVLSDQQLWARFVQQGFARGAGRAFDDVTRKRPATATGTPLSFYGDGKEAFLKSSFAQPEALEKVKLLASRVFTDLKGVTDAMATAMTRTLADGLVRGRSPRDIARDLIQNVNGIGKKRAELVAHTEIVRAHAEGQLLAFKQLGVQRLGVEAEFLTTGDSKVCKVCKAINRQTFTLKEASGVIPVHPRCRCAWIPKLPELPKEAARPEAAGITFRIRK